MGTELGHLDGMELDHLDGMGTMLCHLDGNGMEEHPACLTICIGIA